MLSPSDPHQLTFYLTYSNILSGILSDILFGILSRIYSHSLWHVFGPRCAPLHPAQKRRRGEEKEGGRVAPLLKSRDPHLTGGGKVGFMKMVLWTEPRVLKMSILGEKLGADPKLFGQREARNDTNDTPVPEWGFSGQRDFHLASLLNINGPIYSTEWGCAIPWGNQLIQIRRQLVSAEMAISESHFAKLTRYPLVIKHVSRISPNYRWNPIEPPIYRWFFSDVPVTFPWHSH